MNQKEMEKVRKIKLLIISVIFLVLVIGGYFLDPTSVFEKKWIQNFTDMHDSDDKWVGTFMVQGLYKSQGTISSNQPIEIYMNKVEYYINKDYFKDYMGKDGIWPNNTDARLCPENAKVSGDDNWVKLYCLM